MTHDEIEKAEDLRRSAEHEREEHELRRRIAEGGPDQHVPGDIESPPGRWEAEQERKTAEKTRQRTMRTTYARFATLIALPLAFVAFIPSLIGILAVDNQNNRLEVISGENRDALQLLCQVSKEFDSAIVAAADQIKTSRMSGTYDRLVEQGLLTEENVAAAIETEQRYRKTHEILANPVACERIED